MIAVYRVEVLSNGVWKKWGSYLDERVAERVKLHRQQEGLTARVVSITVD